MIIPDLHQLEQIGVSRKDIFILMHMMCIILHIYIYFINCLILIFYYVETTHTLDDQLKNLGTFQTAEEFWSVFNNIKPSSGLALNSNYHLFKEGVQPMWEDPANKEGGKFVLTLPKQDAKMGKGDEWWLYTVLAVIGETMDATGDEVCGCGLS